MIDSSSQTGLTILLCEDDHQVRPLFTRILLHAGYKVLVAEDPDAALKLLAEYEGEIDLLFTDMRMPGMDGRSLALHVLFMRPSIRVIFASGFMGEAEPMGFKFLAKPVTPRQMLEAVREVLETDG